MECPPDIPYAYEIVSAPKTPIFLQTIPLRGEGVKFVLPLSFDVWLG